MEEKHWIRGGFNQSSVGWCLLKQATGERTLGTLVSHLESAEERHVAALKS